MIPIVLVRLFEVARLFCRRRLSLSAGVLVSGLAIALWGGAILAHRRASRELPRTFAKQLASHAAATAAETVAVAAAKRQAAGDSVVVARAQARARPHTAAAKRVAAQADSLARSSDWEEAYDARGQEVRELLTVDALKDTALVAALHGATVLNGALQLAEIRASRSDTLLDESVRLLHEEGGCGIRCRARRLLYVGAVVGAMVVTWKFARS